MAEIDDAKKGPPAPAGLSAEDVKGIIAESLKPVAESLTQLGENQKLLGETIGKLQPAPAPAPAPAAEKKGAVEGTGAGAGAQQPLTAEAVQKLVADGVAAAMNQQRQSAEQRAERERFVNSETSGLAKLPDVYKRQLGDDPKKWPDEAKSIAATWETDFKGAGAKVEDVGGANREGGKTPAGTAAPPPAKAFLPDTLQKVAADIKLPS